MPKNNVVCRGIGKAEGIRYITYSKNSAMNGLLLSLEYVPAGHMRFKGKPALFNCYGKEINEV